MTPIVMVYIPREFSVNLSDLGLANRHDVRSVWSDDSNIVVEGDALRARMIADIVRRNAYQLGLGEITVTIDGAKPYDIWGAENIRQKLGERLLSDDEVVRARAEELIWRYEDATLTGIYGALFPRWQRNVLQRLDWAKADCTCDCGMPIPRHQYCTSCEATRAKAWEAEHILECEREVEELSARLKDAQDRLARAKGERIA